MPTRRQVYTGSWYYFENILKPELESQGNVFPGGVKQVAQQFGHKWRVSGAANHLVASCFPLALIFT